MGIIIGVYDMFEDERPILSNAENALFFENGRSMAWEEIWFGLIYSLAFAYWRDSNQARAANCHPSTPKTWAFS